MTLDFRQRLLGTTLFVGASMIAAPAFAQETVPPPCDSTTNPDCPAEPATGPVAGMTTPVQSATGENVTEVQDIVITGSRIPQPNLESASPVTVVTAQEVKVSGTSRTEDLINTLPQSFAAQGSNIANGASGTATVNLRGLGSSRTLVLINGRRLMPGDPRNPVADINFIPSALIKRVDVLTGGASSVYGSDAVAGVVNFIMDTNFRGLRIDAQASGFMHDNGTEDSILAANERRGFRPPHGTSFNGNAMDIAASFGAGFDDGRGSIMAYATYRKQEKVLQATRDYSFCALSATDDPDTRFNCGGSATSAFGSFFTNVGTFHVEGNQFVPGIIPFNYAPYNYFQRPDERYTLGAFAEYEISDAAQPYLEAMFMDDRSDAQIAPSGDFFNTLTLNCDNPLLSDQQRGATGTTTVGGVTTNVGVCSAAIYNPADATVTDGDFDSFFGNLVGQTPIFGDDPDFVPDPDGDGPLEGSDGPLEAPLLGFEDPTSFNGPTGTFQRAIVYTARRNIEGGGRDDNLDHTAYRIVAGVRGDLDRGLSYDAYYQYGTTKLSQVYKNDFSVRRLGQALDVVIDPDTGEPVCRGSLDGTADQGCVPYNIFTSGGVDPAALAFLQTPLFSRGSVREQIANLNFTILGGEYGVHMPWTDRGVGLNVGAEYRKEALNFDTDTAFSTGDGAGQGGPTIGVEGAFDVRDLFAEVEIPIINDSFFYELKVGAGYRYSAYKVADNKFNTDTYKLQAEFAPIRDVRLRGSYNRAVRAPNVVELFAATSIGLAGNNDPCAGSVNPVTGVVSGGATAAECALTGVTAAQYGNITANPADQYNALFGGNTTLQPEKADTYTVGVVLQPRWIPGLALTVDYFDIKVEQLISAGAGFQTILAQCITTGQLCGFINRNPNNGSLFIPGPVTAEDPFGTGFIDLRNTNLGGLSTKGIDFNGSYARQIGGMGSLSISMVGTYLDELITNPLLDTTYDCAGFYGASCGTPNPEWRHKLRVGFTFPSGIGISGQWRFFSSVKNDSLSNDPDLSGGTPGSAPGNAQLNSASYFDLALTARLADRFNFRLGANNILDRDPPIAGGEVTGPPFGSGNTFPQVYDALGRYVFAGVTVDF